MAKKQKKETFQERYERYKNDPKIIDRFFSDKLDEKQRKKLAEHIGQMRVDHADKLQKLREHTDENGNYKA